MTTGQPVHFRDSRGERGAGATTYVPHSDLLGSGLELSVVTGFAPGGIVTRRVPLGRDEVLFVLTGAVRLRSASLGDTVPAECAAHLAGGVTYTLSSAGTGPWEVAIVGGPASGPSARPAPTVLRLAGRAEEPAVGNRHFQVLFDPACGCSGMTQFVGFVPKVRTARHIHPYSEMLCIVRGGGLVEIDGVETPVGPGSCYYLPAGTPHLVQNRQDEYLLELGVFTPAGSPAQNTPVES